MSIKAVFFDLDGTLLPMNMDSFSRAYFSGLVECIAPLGFDKKAVFAALQEGIVAMSENDGSKTNECAFWEVFDCRFGDSVSLMKPELDKYYNERFDNVKSSCGFNLLAKKAVEVCKAAGLHIVLATNPFFPRIATEKRARWAGLEPDEFELITTYEDNCFCKPNINYYAALLKRLSYLPEECLMVGNDTVEDTVAEKLGMKVFLITDCIINHGNESALKWENGDFNAFIDFISKLS